MHINIFDFLKSCTATEDSKILFILMLIAAAMIIDFITGTIAAFVNPKIEFRSKAGINGILRKIASMLLLIIFIPISVLIPNGFGAGLVYTLYIANSGKYDLVCELHLNASNGKGHGSEVLYYPGDNRGKLIADRGSMALEKLGFRNRGAKSRGDLYILAQTKPTAVLFESFFCDNVDDCNKANKLGYEKIAKAIAYGLTGQTSRLKETPAVNNYPSPKKEGGYSVKTNTPGDVLNVRISPSLGSKIVSTYSHGSKIYVYDVIKNNQGTWYKIEYKKGSFGFVSAKFCMEIK